MTRGQSHVVGVALLLGITVVALAGLTAGIGSLVDHNAASADAERVADALDDAHAPTETTGTTRTELPLGGGAIDTESRTVRLFGVDTANDPPPLGSLDPEHNATDELVEVETDAIIYENEHRTVTSEAGAILLGGQDSTRLYRAPPIHADNSSSEPLLIGLSVVDADVPRLSSSDRGTRLSVTTTVGHERQPLTESEYRLAIETTHPGAWERHFEDLPTRAVQQEETTVVVVGIPGDRPAYLVTHRSTVEVRVG